MKIKRINSAGRHIEIASGKVSIPIANGGDTRLDIGRLNSNKLRSMAKAERIKAAVKRC